MVYSCSARAGSDVFLNPDGMFGAQGRHSAASTWVCRIVLVRQAAAVQTVVLSACAQHAAEARCLCTVTSTASCMIADARKDVCTTPHNDLALAEANVTYGALARVQHHHQQVQCNVALQCTA